MPIHVIDSASLYQLLPTLEAGHTRALTAWSWRTSVEVTCALISASNTRIAPAPAAPKGASGNYAILTKALKSVVTHKPPTARNHQLALQRTKNWASANTPRLKECLASLRADERNYQPWLCWAIRNAWLEHTTRLNGLFNDDFLVYLAKALDLDKKDLVRVQQASTNPVVVQRWIGSQKGGDFEIARDAYVLAALLRGRYHDAVTELSGGQISHHPIRRGILNRTAAATGQNQYVVSSTENFLAYILIQAAWRERGLKARAHRWATSVASVRQELLSKSKLPEPTIPIEEARTRAAKIARDAGVRVEPKWVEGTIEGIAQLATAGLAHLLLEAWRSVPVGVAAHETVHRTGVGKRIGALLAPAARLRSLARAPSGRIQAHWE